MNPTEITAVAAVTSAIVEIVKRSKLGDILSGWLELLALVIGVVTALIFNLGVVDGIIAALMAMGVYDSIKSGVNKIK